MERWKGWPHPGCGEAYPAHHHCVAPPLCRHPLRFEGRRAGWPGGPVPPQTWQGSTLDTRAARRLALWQGTARQPGCAFTPHHFQHRISHSSHIAGQEPAKARPHSSLQRTGDTNKSSWFFLQKLDPHNFFYLNIHLTGDLFYSPHRLAV